MYQTSKRTVSILLILCMFSTLLSGCSVAETTLMSAVLKTWEASSYETVTNLSFQTNASGIDDSASMFGLKPSLAMLDSVNIKINEKRNTIDSFRQSKSSITIDMGGVWTAFEAWQKNNVKEPGKNENPIIMFPKVFASFFPYEFTGREYVVLDDVNQSLNLNKEETAVVNSILQNFNTLYPILLKEILQNFNPGFMPVENLGIVRKGDDVVSQYRLKLTDAQCKRLIESLIVFAISDELIGSTIKKLVLESANYSTLAEKNNLEQEIDAFFTKLSDETSQERSDLLNLFKEMQNITLLGPEGLQLTFDVDRNGFYRGVTGYVQLTGNFINFMPEATPFLMTMNINTSINNVNSPLDISMPILTEKNSFKFTDIQKRIDEESTKGVDLQNNLETKNPIGSNDPYVFNDTVLDIYYNEKLVTAKSSAIQNQLITMIPLRTAAKAIGANVEWNSKNNTIIVETDTDTMYLRSENPFVYMLGEHQGQYLNEPMHNRNGTNFISLEDIRILFKKEVELDTEKKRIIISALKDSDENEFDSFNLFGRILHQLNAIQFIPSMS